MAHFAELDENNTVKQVIVVNNKVINNLPFPDSEPIGVDFCRSLFGQNTLWKQASYNGNFRFCYPGIGYWYREDLDVFVPPQPYPSWVLNPTTYTWESPVPHPTDGKRYVWDETTQSWVEVT